MRGTSYPGKTDGGYLLLNVLTSIVVASIGLTALLGGFAAATAFQNRAEERVLKLLEEKTEAVEGSLSGNFESSPYSLDKVSGKMGLVRGF